jgi:hypothetical protein
MAKNLLTGSLKNRSIDNLETQKKCNLFDAERKSISGLEGLKYFSDIFYEDFF